MREAVCRLKNTIIAASAAFVHRNMRSVKKVLFRCGMFLINKRQENTLKKTCESVLLKKMGSNEKFPREALHARKSVLGVRLMSPTTTMSTLALKSHAGHNRIESEVLAMVKINEENARLHAGFAAGISDAELEWKLNVETRSDKIRLMLKSRKLRFANWSNENK